MRKPETANDRQEACCIYLLVYLLIGLAGRWLVDYDCTVLFGRHPPFWISFVAGFFGWALVLPLALVLAVLTACGLHVPIFQLR